MLAMSPMLITRRDQSGNWLNPDSAPSGGHFLKSVQNQTGFEAASTRLHLENFGGGSPPRLEIKLERKTKELEEIP
jgi:hypothetical protein